MTQETAPKSEVSPTPFSIEMDEQTIDKLSSFVSSNQRSILDELGKIKSGLDNARRRRQGLSTKEELLRELASFNVFSTILAELESNQTAIIERVPGDHTSRLVVRNTTYFTWWVDELTTPQLVQLSEIIDPQNDSKTEPFVEEVQDFLAKTGKIFLVKIPHKTH